MSTWPNKPVQKPGQPPPQPQVPAENEEPVPDPEKGETE